MDIFCRACMCQFPEVSKDVVENYNIFQIPNLADKLMMCTNMPVQPSDKYPGLLCRNCFEKVEDFYQFQAMYRESLKIFEDIVTVEEDVNCEEITCDQPLSDNCADNKESIQPQLEWDGTLSIDDSIQFDAEDFIIEDGVNEVESKHSTQIQTEYADHIEQNNLVAFAEQMSDQTKCPQNYIFQKIEVADDIEGRLEVINESEEECVVDTLSEDDDEVSFS